MQGAFIGENATLQNCPSLLSAHVCVCVKKERSDNLPFTGSSNRRLRRPRIQVTTLCAWIVCRSSKACLPASQPNSKQQFHFGFARLIFSGGSIAHSRGDFERSAQPWSLFAMHQTISGLTLVSVSSMQSGLIVR